MSNLNRYSLDKHLLRKNWRNEGGNERNETRQIDASKIHFEDECVLCEIPKNENQNLFSRGLQVKRKERKKRPNRTSSRTETRSTGETGHTLFTDTNSSNESHERFDDELINNRYLRSKFSFVNKKWDIFFFALRPTDKKFHYYERERKKEREKWTLQVGWIIFL